MENTTQNTGLKLPPPIIYAAALFLGLVLNYFFPITFLPDVWGWGIGIANLVVAGAIIPFVIIRYKKVKTPFDVRKPASTLVTDGPNHYSRNPGYLALTLLYLGIGFILNNIWILSFVVPVVLIMDLWIIRSEERHLEAVFGEQYLRYKSAVRRWV